MPRRNVEVRRNDSLTPVEDLYRLIRKNGYTGDDSKTVTFSNRAGAVSYRVRPDVRRRIAALRKVVDDETYLQFLERHEQPAD